LPHAQDKQILCFRLELAVGDKSDHVMNTFFLTQVVRVGNGKAAAISPQNYCPSRIGPLEFFDQHFQDCSGATEGIAVARPENGCHGEPGNTVKDKKRIVDILPEILPMDKAELLATWVGSSVESTSIMTASHGPGWKHR